MFAIFVILYHIMSFYVINVSNEDTREDIRWFKIECPPGYYCPGDGKRYLCPSGTYADIPGSTSEQCQGLCDHGK